MDTKVLFLQSVRLWGNIATSYTFLGLEAANTQKVNISILFICLYVKILNMTW